MTHSLSLTTNKRARIPALNPVKGKKTKFPDSLPVDILRKSLGFLSYQDFCTTRRVCKGLQVLNFDLWMKLNGVIEYDFVRRFLQAEVRMPLDNPAAAASPSALIRHSGNRFQSLDLNSFSNIQTLNDLFPANGDVLYPQLRHLCLRFGFNTIGAGSQAELNEAETLAVNIAKHCPNVTQLTLKMPIKNRFFVIVDKLKTLQSLSIVTHQLEKWPDELAKKDKLKEVHLTADIASSEALGKLKKIQPLSSLALEQFPLQRESWQAISELTQLSELQLGPYIKFTEDCCLLEKLTNLDTLHLHSNDDSIPTFPNFNRLTNLRHLTLSSFSYMDMLLFVHLNDLPLQSLVLNDCEDFTDSCFWLAISKNPTLRHLQFDIKAQSRITDEGLISLSKSQSIESIKIKSPNLMPRSDINHGITEEGLIRLGNISSLRKLDLSEFNNFLHLDLDRVAKALLEKNPKLTILRKTP